MDTNFFGMAGAMLARTPARVASKRETAFRTPAQQKLERLAFRGAHRIVANAAAVRRWLIDSGVAPGKIVTLYNGLDLARLTVPENWQRDAACVSFGVPATRRYVVIVANLRHQVKNHPMFLRAAQKLRAAVPDAGFLIAGEGELQPDLEQLAAELGIAGDVFFLGRCTRVAELLALSEACVLSSRAEGFSNSILEYMAAARPVVVTDVGGAREAVSEGENGFLVPSDDDELMAQRLISLLQNPSRAQAMGAHGRRVVQERFSCAAQLSQAQELYESLGRVKA
jgi:glycosyltransferase involved in cell wall biosynthesis